MAVNPAAVGGVAGGINIGINATETASRVVAQVQQSLGSLGNFATGAQQRLVGVARAITDVGNSGRGISNVADTIKAIGSAAGASTVQLAGFVLSLQAINVILEPLANLKTVLEGVAEVAFHPITQSIFSQLSQEGEELLNETASLNEVLTELSHVLTNIGGGLFSGQIDESGQKLAKLNSVIANSFQDLGSVINTIDNAILSTYQRISDLPGKLAQNLGGLVDSFSYLAGASEPIELYRNITQGANQAFGALAEVGQQLTFFQSGLQTLQQIVATGPFRLLIGQNQELQQQLLATQASLAATNQVFNTALGQAVSDPTQAIVALTAPVENAIQKIREGSLELVGVTSSQLVESFNIIATQVGSVGINLDEAAQLTLSFAAALGTLGVPLFQARQEITSILQGTIDQNSVLAKSINLTNAQVKTWVQQGKVYDELTKKLESFRSGNALAARTIEGITSNIQEIIEITTLEAGKDLIDPIVNELDKVYQYLERNRDALTDVFKGLATTLFAGFQDFYDGLGTLINALQPLIGSISSYLISSLANAFSAAGKAIEQTTIVIRPIINVLTALFEIAKPLTGPFLELGLQFKTLQLAVTALGGSFGVVLNALPGVGELLFGINLRTATLINQLPNLTQVVGQGAAGFILLGKNLNEIPFLANAVSKSLEQFGVAGKFLQNLAPPVASFAFQLVSVAKVFPPLEQGLKAILSSTPTDLVKTLGNLVAQVPGLQGLSGLINKNADNLQKLVGNTNLATLATAKFNTVLSATGIGLKQTIVNFALLSGGLLLGIRALDRFVLKNQDLLDTFSAIGQGIGIVLDKILDFATNPALVGSSVAIAAIALQLTGLYGIALKVVATSLVGWVTGVSGAMTKLAGVLQSLNIASLATFAQQSAVGFQALSIAMTQGTAASAAFLKTNNIAVLSLGSISAGFKAATASVYQFIASVVASTAAMGKQLITSFQAAIANLVAYTTSAGGAGRAMLLFARSIATATVAMGRQLIASITKAIASLIAMSTTAGTTSFSFSLLAKNIGTTIVAASRGLVGAAGRAIASLVAMATAAAGGAASFGTLATAIWTALAPILAIVAPIIAVGAALAGIGWLAYQNEVRKSTELTQQLTDKTSDLALSSTKLVQELKRAREEQQKKSRDGISLTEEEFKQNQQLLGQRDNEIKSINKQINELRILGDKRSEINRLKREQRKTDDKEEQQALENEIQRIRKLPTIRGKANQEQLELDLEFLKKRRDLLAELTEEGFEINPVPLQALGSVFDQLQSKATSAEDAINKAAGDPEIFKSKAGELTDLTNKQLELGQITAAEARRRFELIADNILADQELQLKAQQAITKSYDVESGKRLAIIKAQQAEIAAAADVGELSPVEAAKRTTELRKAELDEQLNNLKAAKDAEIAIERQSLEESFANLDKQAAEASKRLAAAQGDPEEFAKQTKEQLTQLKNTRSQLLTDISSAEAEGSFTALEEFKRALKTTDKQIKELESRKPGIDTAGIEAAKAELEAISQARTQGAAASDRKQQQINQERVNRSKELNAELKRVEVDGERQIYQARITEVERQEKRALDVVKAAANERIVEIRRLQLQDSSQAAQAAAEEAKIAQSQAEAELEIEKRKLRILESLPKFQSPQDEENRQEQIRQSRLKTQDLTIKSIEAEKRAYDAYIQAIRTEIERNSNRQILNLEKQVNAGVVTQAEADRKRARFNIEQLQKEIQLEERNTDRKLQLEIELQREITNEKQRAREAELAAVERQNNKQILNLEKQVNVGSASQTEVERQRAQLAVERLRKEIELETTNRDRRLQLEIELQRAIATERERARDVELAAIEQQNNQEILNLQKRINAGEATTAQVERQRAQLAVERLRKEIELETTNQSRRLQLEIELQNAIATERERARDVELAAIEQEQTQRLIQEQKRLNLGLTTQTQVERERSALSVARLRKELELEKTNRSRRLQLELELQRAIGELQQRNIALREEQISRNLANQANLVEEQNQAWARQVNLIDSLDRAMQQRNRLLEVGRDLSRAAADFATGELEILSQTERSERKKQQLAQVAAAIRLVTLQQEQAFEQESLKLRQQQNRLALEREVIENRISQTRLEAQIAQSQAELQIQQLKKDSTPEEIRATELRITAQQQELELLRQQQGFIGEQQQVQSKIDAAERQRVGFQQRLQRRQAQAQLAEALPTGARRRAQRNLQQQIAEDFGADSYRDLLKQGRVLAAQVAEREFQSTGDVKGVGNIRLRGVNSNTPALSLPSADLQGLGIKFESSGNLFVQGIDKLSTKLEQITTSNGIGGQVFNINVGGNQRTVTSNGNGISLERVVDLAKSIATAG